jgi:teichuronic acid biosynthesis glycosyltransferase TuaC
MAERRLRVFLLAQGYPSPADRFSGAFHDRQLALIAELGVEATMVIPIPWVPPGLAGRNPRWARYAALPARQTAHGVPIYRVRYPALPRENTWGMPDITQGWAVRRLLKQIGYARPDIVHAFFGLPTGAVARRLAQSWKVPFGITLLGDDVTRYPHFNRRNFALLRQVCADAGVCVANSPSLAHEAQKLTGAPVAPLSIGIDFDRWRPADRAETRAALGIPKEAFVVLFVGGMIEAKGVADLRDAIRDHTVPGLTMICIGDGPLRAGMEAVGARCVGVLPQAEIGPYMVAADALILPSHHEGLGMVIVEASGIGLAAAGSDTGGIADLLGEERGWLFPTNNPPAIARTLAEMATNPQERQIRAKRLNDFVHATQDIFTNTRRLVEGWRNLAGH